VKPNRLELSLIQSAISDDAAIPIPLSASSVRAGSAKRRVIRRRGSSSPAPTIVAAMKFNKNSVPIVGMVENPVAVYSYRWSGQ
jgi:hypothetical protein